MIIHDVQQNTPEWHNLKAGTPSASAAGSLITSNGQPSDQLNDYAEFLAAELYAGESIQDFDGNKWTRRGHEIEPEAALDYEMERQIEVEKCGFVTNNLMTYGCSPDRLVGPRGLLEIKCLSTKYHIKALRYYVHHGKAPGTYYPQCQMQLLVFERNRDWVDLMYYHPKLPNLIVRHTPDKSFLQILRKQLKELIVQRGLALDDLKQFSQQH